MAPCRTRRLEDQQAGARIEAKSHKKNAGDFVLWKESSAVEPGWDAKFNGETIPWPSWLAHRMLGHGRSISW